MTNWEKYFGSPEKTAIIIKSIADDTCEKHGITQIELPVKDNVGSGLETALDVLEWLQEEADGTENA